MNDLTRETEWKNMEAESTSLRDSLLKKSKKIKSKKDLKEWLSCERQKYRIGNPIIAFLGGLLFFSEKAVLWRIQRRLRITEYHLNCGHKLRYKINLLLYHRVAFKSGIKIPPNTCGKGLRIVHIGQILINGGAVIGENASLHVNTSIVAGSRGKNAVIGDNLLMFVGATVIKGVTITDNVTIGAGAVVNRDVEETNVSVAGVPAKILK